GDILTGGQGGLGEFTRSQTGVNVLASDVHTVGVFSISAQNAKRYDMDVIFRRQAGRQISTGIRQQCNFLWGHDNISKSFARIILFKFTFRLSHKTKETARGEEERR